MVDEVSLDALRRAARAAVPGLAALLSLERVTDKGGYVVLTRLISGDGAHTLATGLGYGDTVAMAGKCAEMDALQRLLGYQGHPQSPATPPPVASAAAPSPVLSRRS
ncbi:MAG TPA: hypothetical protein VGN26_02900 [Armatimonadota bacterium]|jgi:hypothetical protein